ncbi:unnamed protein product [Brassicogethes aeneus]|uniref:Uncharacterized protein n=1 Tax=Brassicogethes aeneus TaxID=1431903 RepID=A0A9P0FPC7_BRAAE|nr:unnamed protein product [Brassicogethes aeneus]
MNAPLNLYYKYFKKNLEDEKKQNGLTKAQSSLVLAHNESGNYFPAIILGDSTRINPGYRIYFIHSGEETDVPRTSVIGNFSVLVEREVSFILDDRVFTGKVISTDKKKDQECPKNFFVQAFDSNEYHWVGLPNLFLNKAQFISLTHQ